MLAYKSIMAPLVWNNKKLKVKLKLEPALDTCQVCAGLREAIDSHLSQFVNLYERLKVKQQ